MAKDLSDKPSVAVFPFTSPSGDAELENFSDCLTEKTITGLSRTNGVWVIARNTMFTYKGRSIDVRTVAKDLGVGYALEGSVQKAEGRIRVTAQLVEAETGHHLWAAKIDHAMIDLFRSAGRLRAVPRRFGANANHRQRGPRCREQEQTIRSRHRSPGACAGEALPVDAGGA